MDFSDYPEDHPNHDKTNKKVLAKFKDELNEKIMTHFIGLKPKAYAFKVQGDKKEQKKFKGVKHTMKWNDIKSTPSTKPSSPFPTMIIVRKMWPR